MCDEVDDCTDGSDEHDGCQTDGENNFRVATFE